MYVLSVGTFICYTSLYSASQRLTYPSSPSTTTTTTSDTLLLPSSSSVSTTVDEGGNEGCSPQVPTIRGIWCTLRQVGIGDG